MPRSLSLLASYTRSPELPHHFIGRLRFYTLHERVIVAYADHPSLAIAESRIVGLIQGAASKDNHADRRRRRRKLELGLPANMVRIGLNHRKRIPRIVEGHGTECGDGEHSESSAHDGLIVAKRTEGDADSRIEIALVQLAQALGQMILARRQHVGAGSALPQ